MKQIMYAIGLVILVAVVTRRLAIQTGTYRYLYTVFSSNSSRIRLHERPASISTHLPHTGSFGTAAIGLAGTAR
jgi:hypothetical protein